MATVDQLATALRNADAAGDVEAAKALAQALVAARGVPAEPATPPGDEAAAIGRGIINGVPIVGPALLSGVNKGVAGVRSWQSGKPYEEELRTVQGFSDATAKANPWSTTAGELGGAIVGTAPMVMAAPAAFGVGPGSLIARSGASAVTGGAIGGADAAARGGSPETVAMYGFAGGALAPGVAAGIGRALAPVRPDPVRQPRVDVLRREGVDVLAGQASGSKSLRYAESALSDLPLAGGGARELAERQGRQFTAAAARRMGETADNLGPETMQRAATRIGGEFDSLAARNTLRADPQFAQDLGKVLNGYDIKALPSEQKAIVGNLVTDLVERIRVGGGTLPGETYQALRSSWRKMAEQARGTPYGDAMKGMQRSLDDAMERSVVPADKGAWKKAQREYAAMKTLEKAMGGAGEAAAAAVLSPQMLRSVTAGGSGKTAYVRGQGQFADLARAGAGIMQPMPQSGTAPRASITAIASSLFGGAAMSGSPGLTAASVAAAAGPSLVGRALMSRGGRPI